MVVEPPSFSVTMLPDIVAMDVFAIEYAGVNPEEAVAFSTNVP